MSAPSAWPTPWRWLPPGLVPHPLERQKPARIDWRHPARSARHLPGARSVPFSLAIAKPARARRSRFISRIPYGGRRFRPCRRPGPRPIRPSLQRAEDGYRHARRHCRQARRRCADGRKGWRPWAIRLLGVAIGGPTRRSRFSHRDARALCPIPFGAAQAGFGLAITPSRRTPRPFGCSWEKRSAGDARVFLWDLEGRIPTWLSGESRPAGWLPATASPWSSEAIAPARRWKFSTSARAATSLPRHPHRVGSGNAAWRSGAEPTPARRLRCDDPGGGRRQTPSSGQALRRPYGLRFTISRAHTTILPEGAR